MLKQPSVSVIMPVYNASRFLKKAIESILNQSYKDFEFIVINDHSTDESEAIIHSYNDDRIKYYLQKKNLGVVAAMNKGLSIASTPFIAVMHADDISHPYRLEKQLQMLQEDQTVAVIAGKSIFINENDEKIDDSWSLDERTNTAYLIKKTMISENCISHPTVMMRTELAKKYGYQSSPHHKNFAVEDYPLWLNILSDGLKIEKLSEPVLYYRVHNTSATASYLRKKNPFKVNYHTKKFYLKERRKQGKLNDFDEKVETSMYLDLIKAWFKNLKASLRVK